MPFVIDNSEAIRVCTKLSAMNREQADKFVCAMTRGETDQLKTIMQAHRQNEERLMDLLQVVRDRQIQDAAGPDF